MTRDPHILLLGGSLEARLLAEALTARDLAYTVWLSEAPRGAAPLPQVPQLRPFASGDAMCVEIVQRGFTAVLDASHAFDRTVSEQGAMVTRILGLPYLRVERPAWDMSEPQRWHHLPSVAQANSVILQGARVFCTTGWDSLPDYAEFRGEVLMLRQTRRHTRAAVYPFVELVFGNPPFDAAYEAALFSELRVDLLICRNLGGEASRPKLDAAAALGIDVILIDKPAAPTGVHTVSEIKAALDWVDAL